MRCHRNVICLERDSEDIVVIFHMCLIALYQVHVLSTICILSHIFFMLLLQVEAEKHQDVVVYDQSTRDVNGLATDSFLSILLGKLDSCFHSVSILTGRIWQQLGGWGVGLKVFFKPWKGKSLCSCQPRLWYNGGRKLLTLLFSMLLCR